MSSLQLSSNHIPPAGPLPLPAPMVSQTGQTEDDGDGGAAYVQNYVSLFGGEVVSSSQSVVSSVSQPLSEDPLVQCLPGQNLAPAAPMVPLPLNNTSVLDEAVTPTVITHTAPSTVTPSDTATTFSHISPPPSQLQPLAPLPASHKQHPQAFALPRSFQANTSSKVRSVQRFAPATSTHLIFPGQRCSCINLSFGLSESGRTSWKMTFTQVT